MKVLPSFRIITCLYKWIGVRASSYLLDSSALVGRVFKKKRRVHKVILTRNLKSVLNFDSLKRRLCQGKGIRSSSIAVVNLIVKE